MDALGDMLIWPAVGAGLLVLALAVLLGTRSVLSHRTGRCPLCGEPATDSRCSFCGAPLTEGTRARP